MGFDSKMEARIEIKGDQNGDGAYSDYSVITFNREASYSETFSIAPSGSHSIMPDLTSIQDICLFSNVPLSIHLQVGAVVVGPIQVTSKFVIQGGNFQALSVQNLSGVTGSVRVGIGGY
jgi:hypothetical protein